MTAGRGTNIAAMESHKRKLSGRGRGPVEPADVQIGRDIVGKVGNSKKAMIGQTRRFGQVWTEMVVICCFLYSHCCCFWLSLLFHSSFLFYLFANAMRPLVF